MATAKKTASAAEPLESLAFNPEGFKQGYEKFAKGMNDLADFQKKSLEALMASAGSFAKGAEKAASDQSAFVKTSYEEGLAAVKAAAASKSVQEAFDVQSDYFQAAFERNVSQFTKLTDHWLSTTKEAAEPLTARYTELVEKVEAYRP